jgi:GH15 family glucan-1,4-alpha-glucosidase
MYKKISEYGFIGDMHAIALVSVDGSIDYCSMPHIDSPTIFAALLDDEKGGHFQIQPIEPFHAVQAYVPDTNILKTSFKTVNAEAEVIDYMPVKNSDMYPHGHHRIHRCVSCTKGEMTFRLHCAPRPNYAQHRPSMEQKKNRFFMKTDNGSFSLTIDQTDFDLKSPDPGTIIIDFHLNANQSAHVDFSFWNKNTPPGEEECVLSETKEFWRKWLNTCVAGKCKNLGAYNALVNRSLLTLKLLTFQPTGAIAAAATTSLPEAIGQERNWDYRFSWIRDASFTLKALFAFGHINEAEHYIQWLHRIYTQYGSKHIQILYSLKGDVDITERILPHLKGYKNSRPVRVGNDAQDQRQNDIYGEIMDTALRLSDYAGKIDEKLWPFFRDICHLAMTHWQEPDEGIWEVRSGQYHFVYSKVMCWVALDRGIIIAKRYGFDAPLTDWEAEKNKIKQDVLDKGYNPELGSFVQSYGSQTLDSSLLLLPILNFLPFDDPRVQGTIRACREQLTRNGYLLRYKSEDGLEGDEGAFILCNFWLIECLVHSGQKEEAKNILTRTMDASNHLGLLAEEYDPHSEELLGNFPQAFSHIGFLNAVSAFLQVESSCDHKTLTQRLSQEFKKKIPYHLVLNARESTPQKHDKGSFIDIASQLKKQLNELQGAFFNVREGRVNYRALKDSSSYLQYLDLIRQLAFYDPKDLKTDAQKKAFWTNLYNILIIHGVIEFDIQTSVKEVLGFFQRIRYRVGKYTFSADAIEHGILRSNRPKPGTRKKYFSPDDPRLALTVHKLDPRIHFALVCAASSCPPIEFYDENRIDDQLDTAARSFIRRRGFVMNKESHTLMISQIFQWYQKDFGQTKEKTLDWIKHYTDTKTVTYLKENKKTIRIRYLPYNWNLNEILK